MIFEWSQQWTFVAHTIFYHLLSSFVSLIRSMHRLLKKKVINMYHNTALIIMCLPFNSLKPTEIHSNLAYIISGNLPRNVQSVFSVNLYRNQLEFQDFTLLLGKFSIILKGAFSEISEKRLQVCATTGQDWGMFNSYNLTIFKKKLFNVFYNFLCTWIFHENFSVSWVLPIEYTDYQTSFQSFRCSTKLTLKFLTIPLRDIFE